LIIDYRGYGRSEGKPDEAGLYRDAQAAWDFVIHDKSVAEQRVVIFGRSLGGAVAIDLAWRPSVKPAGLIIESSFTSVPDMVRHMIAIMPRLLVRTKMDSLSKITGVTVPKLFIHSRADEIIPYDQGRRLYDAAGEPKQFYTLDTAGHNETEMVGGEPYFNTLHTFITAQLSS